MQYISTFFPLICAASESKSSPSAQAAASAGGAAATPLPAVAASSIHRRSLPCLTASVTFSGGYVYDAVEAPRGALRLAQTSSSYRLSIKPMASPLHTPQRPAGVYHYSVFRQFAGGVGPTALACDSSGRLYVARFELRTCQGTGSVDVINPDGSLEESIAIPAPEVSGLCISPAGDFGGNADDCYWGLPSIERADPAFPPLGYWRGYVWGPMAQLVYWALQARERVRT